MEGRRKVSFKTYDDMLADIDKLTSGDVKLVGNWSLGQIFQHLANSFNAGIDGFSFKAPFFMKIMAGVFMKKKFLYDAIPSGFPISKDGEAQFKPDESTSAVDAAAALRQAVQRLRSDATRVKHPFFGNLTEDEWENFNLRHAEMHLSFAVPVEDN